MNKIDLNKYQDFVQEVTSQESNDSGEMAMAISKLEESGVTAEEYKAQLSLKKQALEDKAASHGLTMEQFRFQLQEQNEKVVSLAYQYRVRESRGKGKS